MDLAVDGLSCARGGLPLLEGLTFSVGAGRALILRGPNGCGKTTLLRTLAGLQPPLSGRISVPPESIAYTAHADGLKATLTVAENLRFWADVFGTRTIDTALDAMALTDLSERPAHRLSAGQKRRLGLARLLVTGRPVWLLDEPTVSLDSSSVALFGAALRAHLAGGGVALVATHIDLGLPEAEVIDLAVFRARVPAAGGADSFDEAFL